MGLVPAAAPAAALEGGPTSAAGSDTGRHGFGDNAVVRRQGGVTRFVAGAPGHSLGRPTGVGAHSSPGDAARAFVSDHQKQLGTGGRWTRLGQQQVTRTANGGHVVRLHQRVAGHPVLGGEVDVSLGRDNEVLFASANTSLSNGSFPAVRVSASRAATTALSAAARAAGTSTSRVRVEERPVLVVLDPKVAGLAGRTPPSLVYRVVVTGDGPGAPVVRDLVLVDAARGLVALRASLLTEDAPQQTLCSAKDDPGVNDPTCPPTGSRNQPSMLPANATDQNAVDASRFASSTYDFFATEVGSTSALGIPGSRAGTRALNSTVRFCDPDQSTAGTCVRFENAYWDGAEMVYGDGFAAADDVVAHELSHSLTEHTSQLFYWYQSGAINESLSDVFGELADQWNQLGTDDDAHRWLIGEDLPASVGVVRDMAHPGRRPAGATDYFSAQPDRMTSPLYFSQQDTGETGSLPAVPVDNGGVHINSGVGNKTAFLIVDGGTLSGVSVPGLGGADPSTRPAAIAKAAKIYYRTELSLTPGADYADLYDVLPAACRSLVGTSGITSADCTTVALAVRATEMDQQPVRGSAPDAPTCTSSVMSTVWNDDLENPASGRWVRSSSHPARGPFYYPQAKNVYGDYSQVYATSGVQEIWGDDPDPSAAPLPRDGTIAMTQAVRVPTGKTPYLRFNHAYRFEWYPASGGRAGLYADGGRVEYSADGGPWQSAAALFDVNGYNHTLTGFDATATRRLYSFRGFGGDSHGYVSSRLNLAALHGRSVRFRFHLTADASIGGTGWFIDDVRFYTCGPRPSAPQPVSAAPGLGTTTVRWSAPSDHGTSRLRTYRVVLKSGSQVLRTATVDAATRSRRFVGLPSGVPLRAQVSAVNGAGAGAIGYSNRLAGTRLSIRGTNGPTYDHLLGALTTTTSAGLANRAVRLFQKSGVTWKAVRQTSTSRGGAYSFALPAATRGTFRTRFGGAGAFQGSSSRTLVWRGQ
jgi:bacillolysin